MMPGLRRALFSALLVLLAPLARAEDLKPLPAGTESLISSGDLASFVISGAGGPSTYSHRMLDSDSETPNGAREVTALTGSGQPWSIELKYPIATAIAEGDILLLRYRLRTVAVNVETGEGEVSAYVQRNRPEWEKIHTSIDTAGSSWKLLAYAFVADRAFGPGESEVGFGFDLLRQTVQLADVELLRLPPGTPLESLPVYRINYEGRAPDAPWRAEADTRIDHLRKGDLRIEVVDRDGRAVTGVTVAVEQLRHAFRFGTAVVPKRLVDEDPDSVIYRRTFLSLFNGAVPENSLKWTALAGDMGSELGDREITLRGLAWARAAGAEVRGHVFVWPGWNNLPKSLRALENDKPALRQAVLSHIADTGAFAGSLTDEWDALNEPFANHDLMDLLGSDAMVEWFHAAAAAVPGQRLYLNDYGILSGGGRNRPKIDAYLATARSLLAQGAPLGGLGVQGHFATDLTPPVRLLAVLDELAGLGLPVRVTEFDIDAADEKVHADYTRDFYTALFNHPAVDGIYTWGFWANQHWRARAAYYRADWSERPNGRALRELLRERWWTRTQGLADNAGHRTERVFAGRHLATATLGSRQVSAEIEVPAQGEALCRLVLPD